MELLMDNHFLMADNCDWLGENIVAPRCDCDGKCESQSFMQCLFIDLIDNHWGLSLVSDGMHSLTADYSQLVGGFNHPYEKYACQSTNHSLVGTIEKSLKPPVNDSWLILKG